jgi:hypothetical protein
MGRVCSCCDTCRSLTVWYCVYFVVLFVVIVLGARFCMAAGLGVDGRPGVGGVCCKLGNRFILQDEYEQVLLNRIVKPAEPVVSYLTPLTGCVLLLLYYQFFFWGGGGVVM